MLFVMVQTGTGMDKVAVLGGFEVATNRVTFPRGPGQHTLFAGFPKLSNNSWMHAH